MPIARSCLLRVTTLVALLPLLVAVTASAQSNSLYVDPDGNVGVGTSSPVGKLQIENPTSNTVTMKLFNVGSSAGDHWEYNAVDATTDHFLINKVGSGLQELRLDEGGKLKISGQLFTGGSSCSGGCDFVFDPDYELESIEEHSEYMWTNRHLRGVGPTPENAPTMNLTEKVGGLINELEKAHIYIDQLHQRLEEQEAAIDELREVMADD